jgi:major membrane immunogen (membrane-anchored lipoprotein)
LKEIPAMKPFKRLPSLLILLFLSFTSLNGQDTSVLLVKSDSVRFKDGIYIGSSRGGYEPEPYWGIVRLKIDSGRFTEVIFSIRDSSLHEYFDDSYERHFAGNPEYIKQSRNDRTGVIAYPGKLMESQDTNKLDAISGATWSYNIFRASLRAALKDGLTTNDSLAIDLRK